MINRIGFLLNRNGFLLDRIGFMLNRKGWRSNRICSRFNRICSRLNRIGSLFTRFHKTNDFLKLLGKKSPICSSHIWQFTVLYYRCYIFGFGNVKPPFIHNSYQVYLTKGESPCTLKLQFTLYCRMFKPYTSHLNCSL